MSVHPRRASRRRRLHAIAGAVLIAVGLAACGPATSPDGAPGAEARPAQDAGAPPTPAVPSTAVTSTAVTSTIAPAPTTTAPGATAVPRASTAAWGAALPPGGIAAAAPSLVPVHISIPRLGVEAEVLAAGTTGDGSLALPANAIDAAWVTASVTPGSAGSSVVAAHVDYDGARGPFFSIDTLAVGDRVDVRVADGSVRTFAVRGPAERRPKVALAETDVFRRTGEADLVLITCGGRFDPATRSYEDNVLVRARLTAA